MGFFQVGVQVSRLAKDPENPDKELIHPPLFRPGTLLFGLDSDNMANTTNNNNNKNNKDTPASDATADTKDPGNQLNTNSVSISAGPCNTQLGTALGCDRSEIHQMLTGAFFGTIGLGLSCVLSPAATNTALCVTTLWVAIMAGVVLLVKPEEEGCK